MGIGIGNFHLLILKQFLIGNFTDFQKFISVIR